jgi:hypothetical protein
MTPLVCSSGGLTAIESTTAGTLPINSRLHRFMLAVCAGLTVLSIAGSRLTGFYPPSTLAAAVAVLPMSVFPAAIWHDRRRYQHRDASLMLPWVFSLVFLIPILVVISARLNFPLHDASFVRMDRALGFDVPAVMHAISRWHSLDVVLNYSYSFLDWFVILAIVLPILTGQKEAAERFLLANCVAFLLSLPLFTLFPAIGPWAGYHFTANQEQQFCEASIRALHGINTGKNVASGFGVVSFPSFHVIWAVLSASALQPFRWLRLAAIVLAALIVLSTVTTGWHYAVDCLGGILIAAISLNLARRFAA